MDKEGKGRGWGVVPFIEIEVCYVGETRFNVSGLGSMLDLLFFFCCCCNG